jgi:hypothetical protein
VARGFKQLPFEWRARVLGKLKGARLAVWLYLYWRSDKENEVEAANAQIARETGLAKNTVKIAKKWLRDHGWLVTNRASVRDAETGQWVVPVITAVVPSLETGPGPEMSPGTEAPKHTPVQASKEGLGTGPENTAAVKPGPSVDTESLVDTPGSDPSGLRVNTSPSSSSSPLWNSSSPKNGEEDKLATEESISRKTLDELLARFDMVEQPSHFPLLEKNFAHVDGNGSALADKMLRFADWMIERFPAKVVSLKDFFYHFNNESYHENGFRLQFDAYCRAEKKRQEPEEEIPRCSLDGICRAPSCSRPWVEEKEGIKLCALCARAYPHYADHIVVMSGHNDCEIGERYGEGEEEIMVAEVPEEEL